MENKWAIILGCSTGHGAATAKQLASEGFGIIGFHLDRGPIKKDALKAGVKGIKGAGKDAKELSAYQEARFLPAVGGMIEHFLTKRYKFCNQTMLIKIH